MKVLVFLCVYKCKLSFLYFYSMTKPNFLDLAKQFTYSGISGRYLNFEMISAFLLEYKVQKSMLGFSVEERPIPFLKFGSGSKRILMWSQMHGNESTTTKAVIDLICFLKANPDFLAQHNLQLGIIPMLNPDGAHRYTRENANKIDLNRDAQELSQPESRFLRHVYQLFKPQLCLNLHDQRTIFGVETPEINPATVSLLAPAFNPERDFNRNRLEAVHYINVINRELQNFIPNQVGRFDDSFNLNCTGDTFQNLGTPTILIEAGHFPNDYLREKTRNLIFVALLSTLTNYHENVIVDTEISEYLKIPQNRPLFFDIVYKNVKINYANSDFLINFAAQFVEEFAENSIFFRAKLRKLEENAIFVGHKTYDFNGEVGQLNYNDLLESSNVDANFTVGNQQIRNGHVIADNRQTQEYE